MSAEWRKAVAASVVLNLAAVAVIGGALSSVPASPDHPLLRLTLTAAAERATEGTTVGEQAGGGPRVREEAAQSAAGGTDALPDAVSAGASGKALPVPAAAQSGPPAAGEAAAADARRDGPGYTPVRIIYRCEPGYPETARIRGSEGTVRLRAVVGSGGLVEAVRVVASSGSADLDAAAVEAVRGWRFAPAVDRLTGRPVSSYVVVPVVFKLR